MSHSYENPVTAIAFALETDEGIEFLRLWNEGRWKEIDQDWPEFSGFIGARTAKPAPVIDFARYAPYPGYVPHPFD
jgi:hypothetical protein